jgi:hypothetical protein
MDYMTGFMSDVHCFLLTFLPISDNTVLTVCYLNAVTSEEEVVKFYRNYKKAAIYYYFNITC